MYLFDCRSDLLIQAVLNAAILREAVRSKRPTRFVILPELSLDCHLTRVLFCSVYLLVEAQIGHLLGIFTLQ